MSKATAKLVATAPTQIRGVDMERPLRCPGGLGDLPFPL
jgi:hypothetical protein